MRRGVHANVLDAQRIARSLARIAHEILERNHQIDELALVGIRRAACRSPSVWRSDPPDQPSEIPTGALDITLYRDDLMRTAMARNRSSGAPRFRSRLTTSASCWSTMCCTPGGRFARRSMR